MRIIKFEELQGPCALYDANRGTTNDASAALTEGDIYSDLMNKAANTFSILLPSHLNFKDFHGDIRSYFYKAINLRASSNFTYREALRDFEKEKEKYGITSPAHLTPDGIFCSMKDYFTWQKLYYKHSTKSGRQSEN